MKKSLKSHSISLLTQKTFIYTAAVAFAVQVIGLVWTIISAQSLSVLIGNHVLHLSLSAGLLPLLVFTVACWCNRTGAAKTPRLFMATLMAFMFLMLQAVVDVLLTKIVFRQQFGYGDQAAIWTSPWLSYIPAAAALITTLLIIVYVFKKSQLPKQNSPSRLVQATFVWTVIVSFVVSSMAGTWHTLVQNNNVGSDDILTMVAVIVSPIAVTGTLFGILFLLSRRSFPPLTRAFIATVYTLVLVFIIGICGFVLSVTRFHEYSTAGIVSVLPIVLSMTLYVAIVAIHKRRKVF